MYAETDALSSGRPQATHIYSHRSGTWAVLHKFLSTSRPLRRIILPFPSLMGLHNKPFQAVLGQLSVCQDAATARTAHDHYQVALRD